MDNENNTPKNNKWTNLLGNAQENIIFGVISVILIAIVFITAGLDGVKYWLTTPITWDKPEYFDMELIEIESDDNGATAYFMLTNESEHNIEGYDLYIFLDGYRTELSGSYRDERIGSYDAILYEETYDDYFDEEEYNLLSGKTADEIDFKYHIKSMESDEKTLINNNGWMKIILIFVIGIACIILLCKGVSENTAVRVALKLCCLPMLLLLLFAVCMVVFLLACAGKREENKQEVKDRNPGGYRGIYHNLRK